MQYYLYRHIRLDTEEPFYIGVGTKCRIYTTWEREYTRAHVTQYKAIEWNSIVKSVGYSVEILYESDDYSEILKKEVEFIKLYGRLDLGAGTLCNKNNGGSGNHGVRWDNDARERQRQNKLGKPMVFKDKKKWRENVSNSLKGYKHTEKSIESYKKAQQKYPVEQYTLDGVLIKTHTSCAEAAKSIGLSKNAINNALNGYYTSKGTSGGYRWRKCY